MAEVREVQVPDIGDFQDVPVIEVMVKAGDRVEKDQGLVTLESDKATMEVPSSAGGIVKEVKVKVGDSVEEGSVIALVEAEEAEADDASSDDSAATPQPSPQGEEGDKGAPATPSAPASQPSPQAGEGDKAASAVPSAPSSERSPQADEADKQPSSQATASTASASGAGAQAERRAPPIPFDADAVAPDKVPYASPIVRAFARELGVDLDRVTGTARGGRITKQDVQGYVKTAMSAGAAPAAQAASAGGTSLQLLPWPQIDFSKFGTTKVQPLSRIRKLSGANLARNWAMIPHVTQFEDADITELEALRHTLNKENEKAGIKVTLLAFLIKASVAALQKYPEFNASLDATGENLILKQYFHIGFAADTPNGLVVPVIRDCDQKGVLEIAEEMSSLAKKAREGKLTPGEMSGGCFSISSLGGIGGTMFTPIINAPEVAILGVSRSSTQPVWSGSDFAPRLILPLSLSYDHRVIDGAAAARFAVYLAGLLADMRRALL